MSTLQKELVSRGYCVSPNNIHALEGVIMYAAGPGAPEPKRPEQVQVTDNNIRVFRAKLIGTPYTKGAYHITPTVAEFSTVDAFFAWCGEHGQISEPGLPAWSQGGVD